VDEKVANTGGAYDPASRLHAGKNRHFDLAVNLLMTARTGLFFWRDSY
jgi:hypothetical protein